MGMENIEQKAQSMPQNFPSALEVIRQQEAEAARLARLGLYDPREEHDACGVGMVASLDGQPRREVVLAGIEALKDRKSVV